MGYFGTISDIDLSKIINVDQEEERTNNRPLWYSRSNKSRLGGFTININYNGLGVANYG